MINEKLIQRTLAYYDKFKSENVVVTPSLPILYFGDLEGYKNSELKVITVGKNPSNNEFRVTKTEEYSFVRFPSWDENKRNLIDSLNPYFIINPLKQWFSCFEPILNGISASYYPAKRENIALHTDICSPLATNPTWSKLPKEKQKMLYEEGFFIWKDLIEELQPDVMFVSVPRVLFKSIFSSNGKELLVFKEKKDGTMRKRVYTVESYKYILRNNKCVKVVFGQAANKPFDTISDKQKLIIGEKCLK